MLTVAAARADDIAGLLAYVRQRLCGLESAIAPVNVHDHQAASGDHDTVIVDQLVAEKVAVKVLQIGELFVVIGLRVLPVASARVLSDGLAFRVATAAART